MSQALRQSELFAGNDWLVIYTAFTQINFNAFDFTSIRQSMTDYIRLNYPENYNDWIDQSEFVAILDLVAYLGESLAYRMDLNARENFIDVARRRESVLRLARFLSYSPQRNYPAQGLVQIQQITTTDNVYDSSGTNLNNTPITWNDPTNSNWFEQFILVMNAAFITTNPFGTPLIDTTINSVDTQLYRLNNISNGAGNFPFNAYIDSTATNFDICNVEFTSTSGFTEVYPNPQNTFQVIYQNDGNGNSSPNTGFFMLFKQGILQKSDVVINQPLENRTIYVNTQNINQSDVWVQTVNDAGYIVTNGTWTRVGYVPTDDISKVLVSVDNVTYNSIAPNVQNIYQVVTQENDQIMLRFGDGRFGQIPTGNLRIWYRVSANENMSIQPDELENIQISIPYQAVNSTNQTLSITFSLLQTVANGATSESNADIARRAGLNYSTQARMVSGNDYNVLPSTNNLALKVKAINRVYSGQSRYIDLNDPTGTYQNTNVFSDDGALYQTNSNLYTEIPISSGLSASEIVSTAVIPEISNVALSNFLYNEWLTSTDSAYTFFTDITPAISWFQSTNQAYSTTGYFQTTSNNSFTPIGSAAAPSTSTQYITEGAMIKFASAGWVAVIAIDAQGSSGLNLITQEGPVTLTQIVSTGDTVVKILPAFTTTLTTQNINDITSVINNKRTFGLSYDFINQTFNIIDVANLDGVNPYNFTTAGSNLDNTWIVRCDYSPSVWRITGRGLQYVFESIRDVKFFFVNTYKSINAQTGQAVQDNVKILKYNGLPNDLSFNLLDTYNYPDGYQEPRRVIVGFSSDLNQSFPDNPESFTNIVTAGSLIFHQSLIDQNGYQYYQLLDPSTVTVIAATATVPTLSSTQVVYKLPTTGVSTTGTFYVGSAAGLPADYDCYFGRGAIYFQWKHFAPTNQRIDPAVSNIIDILVLQTDFYNLMTIWRTNGCNPNAIPTSPTEATISANFSDLEQFKMFSDEIVWRPATFKLLFGATADPELQLSFKVVPLAGTTVSNGEIQSRLIAAVYTFFDVSSWDFGETFYFSELAGYIHQQLLDCIASVVPVPLAGDQVFGDLFEIRCNSDELFFPTCQVSDVEIITSNTASNLRIN